jgi:hypothetical protein
MCRFHWGTANPTKPSIFVEFSAAFLTIRHKVGLKVSKRSPRFKSLNPVFDHKMCRKNKYTQSKEIIAFEENVCLIAKNAEIPLTLKTGSAPNAAPQSPLNLKLLAKQRL